MKRSSRATQMALSAIGLLAAWRVAITIHSHHRQPAQATLAESAPDDAHAAINANLAFTCTYTGWDWHGRPVFQLRNDSDEDLENVMLYSSGGNFMIPLQIGGQAPADISHAEPLRQPPYTLLPHESEWFVAPVGPPLAMYVMWHTDAGLRYEYIVSAG